MEDVRKQEKEKGIFRREKLLGRFTARKLYRQTDKRYDEEYWARLERNWRQWKKGPMKEQRIMETIKKEEEEIGQEESGLREWNKEDNKMGNIQNPYEKL